jgi:hypothetical protein
LHLTFQFDLPPIRAGHRALQRTLKGQRLLYNAALQAHRGLAQGCQVDPALHVGRHEKLPPRTV